MYPISGNLNKVGEKNYILCNFWWKICEFWNCYKINQTIQQRCSISNANNHTIPLKLFYFKFILAKFGQSLPKITDNVKKKQLNIHKILNFDNSKWKTKLKKNLLLPYSRMYVLFNDATYKSQLWIYRSAIIAWTKNSFEYIVPSSSPKWGSEQKTTIYF